ncbi:PD-(D/E)XK nuclease family protein [Salinibacter ruber]|uniref:PD-(D/E)XK endonuclease-like domain-containing protein n=1 Tax=Salinibacter ruber TaxID=146919 RepID=A0A9X2Q5E7_9BACT|nr:PD-(D/E)XK nuclease family protein [Salinibacter ruber]MCS3661835.1 hypothetical protein [Salinibacter ruber]MCS3711616.1 hypothetical protein [Salinibacter ruber]
MAVQPSEEAPASSEHFEIYGGDVILSFDDGDHKYFARSEETDYGHIDSSTQIKKSLAKPALLYWAVNQTIEYLEDNWEAGRAYDEVEIEEMLSDAKSARYKTSGKAMKIGTLVHDWIEEYVVAKIEGKAVQAIDPDQKEVDTDKVRDISFPYNEAARGACEQFLAWEKEAQPEWIASEQRSFSKNHQYAGTYDADAIIDGERVLIDFKTSKRIYDDYWLQLGAYVYAREEETHHTAQATGEKDRRIQYDQMLILRVPKREDQEFEVGLVEDREEIVEHAKTFLSLLQVHNWDS